MVDGQVEDHAAWTGLETMVENRDHQLSRVFVEENCLPGQLPEPPAGLETHLRVVAKVKHRLWRHGQGIVGVVSVDSGGVDFIHALIKQSFQL